MSIATPDEVLQFWFGEPATTPELLGPKMRRWFQGGPAMDADIIARFGETVAAALAEPLPWGAHPEGWLAEILVLDQFTRNVLRDSARMYDGDARAQTLALDGLGSGRTQALPVERRHFALMPLVHAEILALQERAIVEMDALIASTPAPLRPIYGMGVEQSHKYRDVIARFGRFPHRNVLLGRTSTLEEEAFLVDWKSKQPPSQINTLSPKT